jgi:hypothetical protein
MNPPSEVAPAPSVVRLAETRVPQYDWETFSRI